MYKDKVVKLSVKKHPNADNIQLGYVQGVQVIVGNDVAEGAIGVFFNQDGQLSEEFLKTNNLYRHSTLNTDTSKSGFFEDNGRVRAIKLRGERSDGFFCTMDMLAYTGYNVNKLQLGEEFDELNGHKICQKYYTPATSRAIATNKRARLTQADYMLPRHFDTEQLKYNLDKIDVGDLVVISEKCHGTSTRIGFIPVTRKTTLTWLQNVYNKVCGIFNLPTFKTESTQYEFVVGSRNMIVSDSLKSDSCDWYRIETAKPLEGLLKKGEVVYAEIVGFDNCGNPIMNPQSTSKLNDKKLLKQYGQMMTYTYGCAWNDVTKPQRRMLVYRITQVNEDGIEHELSWSQVKARATQLGLECVPELEIYLNTNFNSDIAQTELMNTCEQLVVGNSTLDNSHIREGVCIRLEKANGRMVVLKHKSFDFGVLEGYAKENDNYIDTEEVA